MFSENLLTFRWVFILSLFFFASCHSPAQVLHKEHQPQFKTAYHNGIQAREGYVRSLNYLNDWLTFADPKTHFVPRVIEEGRNGDIWNIKDCAADNYPFMIITSFFTDQEKYSGLMLEILENEKRLTSRVNSIPDTYSFSKEGFDHEDISMDRIIYGATEYMKDGLMPVTDLLGKTPWYDRMIEILDDLGNEVDVVGVLDDGGQYGMAPQAEANGELLQVLSRMYWMTGKKDYLEWATKIGDFFLLGEGFPLKNFDYLRLRDHGCELVAGLCELYVTLHFLESDRKKEYKAPLYELLDFVLAHGRNEDGHFYNSINPKTGEIIDKGISDSWGYLLNGYYSVYMVDGTTKYRDPLIKVYDNLYKYHNFNWENYGADGFADALEGAINLVNREPNGKTEDWIDTEIKIMWSIQDSSFRQNAQKWKDRGIIEGWYGDGNFARTSIMYNLWKSQGTYVQPWSEDIILGAVLENDTLYLVLNSEKDWKGKLYFDQARHSNWFQLPIDWPRINQFPEWFTAEPDKEYHVAKRGKVVFRGEGRTMFEEGIDLELEAGDTLFLTVY